MFSKYMLTLKGAGRDAKGLIHVFIDNSLSKLYI